MNDGRIAFDELLGRYQAGQLSRRQLFQRAAALGMGGAALAAVTRSGGVSAQATPSTLTPSGDLTLVLPRSLVALDPHGAQSVEEATAVVSNHVLGTLTG